MKEIIHRYKKLGTSSVSDALDSLGIEGCLLGIHPQVPGASCAGAAYTVSYTPYEIQPDSPRNASNYIDEVPEGAIVVIDNQGKADCTVWGDILSVYSQQRGIAGTVIWGAARDLASIREMKYPLFSSHVYMRSGKNRVTKKNTGEAIQISGIDIHAGDLIVGDANGCLRVPSASIHLVLERAERIEKTEERIRKAIAQGMDLKAARKQYGYHAPWEEQQAPSALQE